MHAVSGLSPSTFIASPSVPVWLLAVAAAAAAPVCVRWYASLLEKRSRRRTDRALAFAETHEDTFVMGSRPSREDRKHADG
jgi:hypothetical protein